jgi:membrane protease YdiL (CAAX protease family)
VSWRPLYHFYALAFGITWGVGALGLLAWAYDPRFVFSPSNPLCSVAGYGPTIAGFIMVSRLEGRAGLRRLVARAVPTWGGLPWYLGVVLGFATIALGAERLVEPETVAKLPRWDRLLYLLPVTLVTDTGPIGEEFGWRGFALPFLLRRRPPLAAAVTLGLVWGIWHLPTFFITTLTQSRLFFPVFVLNTVALSVIMTWLYRRTGGDLLLMILVHLMANYTAGVLRVSSHAEDGAEVLCAALIVAAGGLRSEAQPHGQSAHDTAKQDWE